MRNLHRFRKKSGCKEIFDDFQGFCKNFIFLKKYHFNTYQVIYQKLSQDVNLTKDIMQKKLKTGYS